MQKPGLLLLFLLQPLVAWAPFAWSQAAPADDFAACLADLQVEARERGLPPWIVDELIPGLEQQRRVIELDRKQPEFVQTFERYLNARVTTARVARGRKLYAKHHDFLDALTRQYGIPGHYLVAFWGLETNYGGYLGSTPTLDSLATLACDQRRSRFFTGELMTALELMQRDDLDPESMRGSWAGAMGHTQFMPSTYKRAAVDGNGDGRIDLWGSPEDALASAARYLQQLGWERGLRWGREVRLPGDFPYQATGLENPQPLRDWASTGVLRADGARLPPTTLEAAVLVPAGHEGPAFLVYQNFRIIMRWNRSEFYALAVGHLADRIAGAGRLYNRPPRQQALTREDISAMQRHLTAAGHDPGSSDGIMGPATRRALRDFQAAAGLVADGYPGPATRAALEQFDGGG